jgi:hypothetical protein
VVNGHQIDDLDLYAERFDPVLRPGNVTYTLIQPPISPALKHMLKGYGALRRLFCAFQLGGMGCPLY